MSNMRPENTKNLACDYGLLVPVNITRVKAVTYVRKLLASLTAQPSNKESTMGEGGRGVAVYILNTV